MPEGTNVKWVGAAEANRDLRRWADQVEPAVVKESRPFTAEVASRTAAKVPVLTGTLAGSVRSVTVDGDRAVSIGDGLRYAPWIEFGGSRGRPLIRGGRYLYPTARDYEDDWGEFAEDVAERKVRTYQW